MDIILSAADYYDRLIGENNDPVRDPPRLKEYMDKWDGAGFIEKMELSPDKSVLEIGVGSGRLAVRVAPFCRSFCGIDISPLTIKRAGENLSACGGVKLICGDYLTYGFDERFDVIYSSLTFMHISDKKAAIKKTAALLKDSGRFCLSADKSRLKYLDFGGIRTEVYPDDPEQLIFCFAEAGLTEEEHCETEFAYIFVCVKKGQ